MLTAAQQQRRELHRRWALQRKAALDLDQLESKLEQHRAARFARGRVYINCPFRQKDEAKARGARWDMEQKQWYVEQNVELADFAAWLQPRDRQALTDARAQEDGLRLQHTAHLLEWSLCGRCTERVSSSCASCPTCEFAAQHMAEFERQAALYVGPRDGDGSPAFHALAQWRATVLTHFYVVGDLSSCKDTAIARRKVLHGFSDLLSDLLPNPCTVVPSRARIKELGNPSSSQAGNIAAMFEHESFRAGLDNVLAHGAHVLVETEHWQSAAELVSSARLPVGDRSISKDSKARLCVRLAELCLQDDGDSDFRLLAGRAGQIIAALEQAQCADCSTQCALLKLRARLCEMQGNFSEAAQHYAVLSQEKESAVLSRQAARAEALTKAAVCAILAPVGPVQTQRVAALVGECGDEGAHKIAPFNVLTAIHSGQLVRDSESKELEQKVLAGTWSIPGAGLPKLLQSALRDHNTQVKERIFLASGRRRGRVKGWDDERGFGFISDGPVSDVFCHVSAITDGDVLFEGDLVEYKVQPGVKGPRAVSVTGGHWGNGAQTVRKRKRETESEPPMPSPHQHRAPRVGMEGKGYWVLRWDFEGRKSFGCFTCAIADCGKTWSSAHAFQEHRQACKSCDSYSFPCCLWYNRGDERDTKERDTEERTEREHHDTARCEACNLGVCLM